jgi:hypothetical protein
MPQLLFRRCVSSQCPLIKLCALATQQNSCNSRIMFQQKVEKKYLVLSLLNNLLASKFGQNGFEIEVR